MNTGKLASQAGHAYLQSYLAAPPDVQSAYHADGMGTKVCLAAGSLEDLLAAEYEAKSLGIPCSLITDSGCANFFEGRPTVTALGLGPVLKHQIRRTTRKFRLL